MNEQEKKQLEIAKKIIEQGHCSGFRCQENSAHLTGPVCGFFDECEGWRATDTAKAYLKKHSKISKKDLLERIEKLEERVDGVECAGDFTGHYKIGTRFTNEFGHEYILAGCDTRCFLVNLNTGRTWNGIHEAQSDVFEGCLFKVK